ncbi:MAG: epoxide hydrolase [Sphingomonadales bacterium]|nr:MAG: epoxide hydrolase [Sphingomonadales bacterium]
MTPFRLNVPQAALDDLRERLSRTRWPERETVDGWQQGVPLAAAQALCDYWRDHYDWRRCEAMLNGLGQHRTTIDGLGIHFLHVRSSNPGALPLILTHGWPGTVVEFHKVVGPLTDPEAHGGRAEDAFHVVAPSLPGYGFSDRPTEAGWSVERIAQAWTTLMRRLGYHRFVAQGGDWGAIITSALGQIAPAELAAIHINMALGYPNEDEMASLTLKEQKALDDVKRFRAEGQGYLAEQSTRPQTLGYGLADSPAGQAMWIYEKFREWADCGGDPLNTFSYDELLDNITIYWLTNTGASSARLYWESVHVHGSLTPTVPTGATVFPGEPFRPSRAWAARKYPDLRYWNEVDRGGHFAAFEQPEVFVDELRSAFRAFR